jgi:uncharacterized membrane protein YuzA (DUF378 family)
VGYGRTTPPTPATTIPEEDIVRITLSTATKWATWLVVIGALVSSLENVVHFDIFALLVNVPSCRAAPPTQRASSRPSVSVSDLPRTQTSLPLRARAQPPPDEATAVEVDDDAAEAARETPVADTSGATQPACPALGVKTIFYGLVGIAAIYLLFMAARSSTQPGACGRREGPS